MQKWRRPTTSADSRERPAIWQRTDADGANIPHPGGSDSRCCRHRVVDACCPAVLSKNRSRPTAEGMSANQ